MELGLRSMQKKVDCLFYQEQLIVLLIINGIVILIALNDMTSSINLKQQVPHLVYSCS